MEPPLCSSPHHLSGLILARLRLAQLVCFEREKNRRILGINQGVALAREKLAGSIDGVGNIFSEKF